MNPASSIHPSPSIHPTTLPSEEEVRSIVIAALAALTISAAALAFAPLKISAVVVVLTCGGVAFATFGLFAKAADASQTETEQNKPKPKKTRRRASKTGTSTGKRRGKREGSVHAQFKAIEDRRDDIAITQAKELVKEFSISKLNKLKDRIESLNATSNKGEQIKFANNYIRAISTYRKLRDGRISGFEENPFREKLSIKDFPELYKAVEAYDQELDRLEGIAKSYLEE